MGSSRFGFGFLTGRREMVDFMRDFDVDDSNPVRRCSEEIYSVRRRKLTPELSPVGFPRVASGRSNATSSGCGSTAWISG